MGYEIELLLSFQMKTYLHILQWFLIPENGRRAEWIGDGFCDDINNDKESSYDGRGLSRQTNFCINCTCIGKLRGEKSAVIKDL